MKKYQGKKYQNWAEIPKHLKTSMEQWQKEEAKDFIIVTGFVFIDEDLNMNCINCTDCINCISCTNCTDCEECFNMTNCNDCYMSKDFTNSDGIYHKCKTRGWER